MALLKFLEGLTDRAKEYYYYSCKMMEHRIKTRLKEDWNEDGLVSILDDLWFGSNVVELEEIEKLPRMWWFQDTNNGLVSELDVYPYAQYFVKQRPHLLGDDVSHLKGTPYFSDKWTPHTAYLVFVIQNEKDGMIEMNLKTMSNEHYVQLQNEYEFLEYSSTYPVFKKKTN